MTGFISKMETFAPSVVAFNGKTVASKVARFLRQPPPTLGPAPFAVGASRVFVLPSSSGSNNDPARFAPHPSKDDWWREFGHWLGREVVR